MSKALPASGEILFQGVTLNEFSPAYDLSNANIGAAILRATSGEDYTDAALAANAEAARQNNLRLGFYHYLTAQDEAGARAQARFFADTISPYGAALRPSMRFEQLSGLSFDAANRIALAFLSEVETLTGAAPAVYTDAESAALLWNRTIAERYPLWLIDETDAELPQPGNTPWKSWVGWQYAALDTSACASGSIPISRFTSDMLAQQIVIPPTPEPEPAPARKLICVTVRLGDTLSAIARLFSTTVDDIVCMNRIANPDLIFPGQRLYLKVAPSVPYPCCDSYTIRRGDTLSGIGERFGVNWRHLAKINEIPDPDRIYPGQTLKLGLCPDA